ncbi:hypothetical protein [Verrucomicrobium sp. BvORR106]|uniref:DUF6797 domain-containing protein n=1 Tax=Verrucomicrobium sp. BvORR106 TaxID=1403819 RepID=UPI000570CE13|nr:hypothetical protein [Verrucomicrobium sp. BvORR106]
MPEGLLQTGDYEIKPEKSDRPVVFRTFLEGAGMQAVTVGSPKGVHAAFDALEMHWAVVWKGRFVDAMTTWEERAMTPAKPLGTLGPALPVRMPLARLKSASDPWPDACGEAAGYHYLGYRTTKDGTPVFLYEVDGLKVQDTMIPAPEGKGLLRKITITGAGDAAAAGWYFLGVDTKAKPQPVILNKGTVEFEELIKF